MRPIFAPGYEYPGPFDVIVGGQFWHGNAIASSGCIGSSPQVPSATSCPEPCLPAITQVPLGRRHYVVPSTRELSPLVLEH